MTRTISTLTERKSFEPRRPRPADKFRTKRVRQTMHVAVPSPEVVS